MKKMILGLISLFFMGMPSVSGIPITFDFLVGEESTSSFALTSNDISILFALVQELCESGYLENAMIHSGRAVSQYLHKHKDREAFDTAVNNFMGKYSNSDSSVGALFFIRSPSAHKAVADIVRNMVTDINARHGYYWLAD